MKVTNCAGDSYAACTIPGCKLTASEPPHTHKGAPVCPCHAAKLAGGACVMCREPFDDGPYRVYPAHDGRAVCIDCWAACG